MDFLNENIWIALKVSLKFVPKVQINNNPALIRIMAWGRPGYKPLSGPTMVRLLAHICATRPHWVNDLVELGAGTRASNETINFGSKYIQHWHLNYATEFHHLLKWWPVTIAAPNYYWRRDLYIILKTIYNHIQSKLFQNSDIPIHEDMLQIILMMHCKDIG